MWKATLSNRIDEVANEMMLIKDAIKMLESTSNSIAKYEINANKRIISRQKTSLLDFN